MQRAETEPMNEVHAPVENPPCAGELARAQWRTPSRRRGEAPNRRSHEKWKRSRNQANRLDREMRRVVGCGYKMDIERAYRERANPANAASRGPVAHVKRLKVVRKTGNGVCSHQKHRA